MFFEYQYHASSSLIISLISAVTQKQLSSNEISALPYFQCFKIKCDNLSSILS
jgi:hypothetical protein